jgi:hypothetical protein
MAGSVAVTGFFAAAIVLALYFLKSGSSASLSRGKTTKDDWALMSLLMGCSCLKVAIQGSAF